jgi:hypothetical protein
MPHHRRADRLDHVLVGREAGGEQLRVARQAGGDELLDEVDAHAAGQEEEQRIRLEAADLRQFGGVIELAELGINLLGHLALVITLEAGPRILAARIVGGDDHDVLETLVLHDLPTASCRLSFCQATLKKKGLHCSPAYCDGPALAEM